MLFAVCWARENGEGWVGGGVTERERGEGGGGWAGMAGVSACECYPIGTRPALCGRDRKDYTEPGSYAEARL